MYLECETLCNCKGIFTRSLGRTPEDLQIGTQRLTEDFLP